MEKTKATIIVSSPDSYSDVLSIFLKCFERFWKDCPYELIIANNGHNWSGYKVIKSDNDNTWTKRILHSLEEIDSELLILFTDDCLISSEVDSFKFTELLNRFEDLDLNYLKLYPSPRPTGPWISRKYEIRGIKYKQPYGRSLMASVWRRSHFIQEFSNSMTGWEIEEKWLTESLESNSDIIKNYAAITTNLCNAKHAVVKGKWLPSAVRKCKSLGISVNVDERAVLSVGQEIFLFFKRNIRKLISNKFRIFLKKVFLSFGISFTTKN